jgi:hypothetical protein
MTKMRPIAAAARFLRFVLRSVELGMVWLLGSGGGGTVKWMCVGGRSG